MTILIRQRNQKQNILMIIFLVVIFATVFIVWRGFSKKQGLVAEEISVATPETEIKIDFDALNNPLLKTLQPFSKIQPFQATTSSEQKIGRTNPFLSQ